MGEVRLHRVVRLGRRHAGALQHRRAELDLPRDVLVSEHPGRASEHAEVPSLRIRLDESDLRQVDADAIDPCVKRQTRDSHALVLLDIGRAGHKMMRSALQRPHRHVAVRIANRNAIRQHEAPDTVGDDVPHEARVVGRVGFGGVHAVEVAQQRARNRGRPDVRADVDHHAAHCQLARLQDLGQREPPLSFEAPADAALFVGTLRDPPRETGDDDVGGAGRDAIAPVDRIEVRRAADRKRRLAIATPVVIGREHRRTAQRQHVFEHEFVWLCGDRAQPPRLEAIAQHVAAPFGSIEPRQQPIALPLGMGQCGVETAPAGQPGDDVAEKTTVRVRLY